jgi:hypothetical protein
MRNPFEKDLRQEPGVRLYTGFCLAALLVMLLAMLEGGLGTWSLLPVLIGCVAVFAHWGIGPPVVLLLLGWLVAARANGLDPLASIFVLVAGRSGRSIMRLSLWRDTSPVADALLCAGTMAYVVGHYRLMSLVRHIFTPDPRREAALKKKRKGTAAPTTATDPEVTLAPRRPAGRVEPPEAIRLVLSVPLWLGLAYLLREWLADEPAPLHMEPRLWHGLLVIAGTAVALAAGSAVLAYARQASATPEAALLYLQDQVWRDTRREQSRINRWLVWARLRWQRRKERS